MSDAAKGGTAMLEEMFGPLTLGRALAASRLGEGMSVEAMARKLGIDARELLGIERGCRYAEPEQARRWAELLGYSGDTWERLAREQKTREQGLPEPFGALLRRLRVEQGRSQADVARWLGVTIPYISDVELGHHHMSEAKVRMLETFFREPMLEAATLTRGRVSLDVTNDQAARMAASLVRAWRALTEEPLEDDAMGSLRQWYGEAMASLRQWYDEAGRPWDGVDDIGRELGRNE